MHAMHLEQDILLIKKNISLEVANIQIFQRFLFIHLRQLCEGGAITTNNYKISKKIQLLRSHGIKRNSKYYWKYDVLENGLNFRLSDVNCSLGISQLKKINHILKFRKKIYSNYVNELDKYQNIIKIIKKEKKTYPSYHLVIALFDFKKLKISRDKFMMIMNKNKIFLQIHYNQFTNSKYLTNLI